MDSFGARPTVANISKGACGTKDQLKAKSFSFVEKTLKQKKKTKNFVFHRGLPELQDCRKKPGKKIPRGTGGG